MEANVAEATNGLADIDGNGEVDALTDGLMLLRYLFNLRGDSLIAGAVKMMQLAHQQLILRNTFRV